MNESQLIFIGAMLLLSQGTVTPNEAVRVALKTRLSQLETERDAQEGEARGTSNAKLCE